MHLGLGVGVGVGVLVEVAVAVGVSVGSGVGVMVGVGVGQAGGVLMLYSHSPITPTKKAHILSPLQEFAPINAFAFWQAEEPLHEPALTGWRVS